jgi:hypothetical protein
MHGTNQRHRAKGRHRVTASKGKTPADDREPEQPDPDQSPAYVAGWHDGWAVGYQAGRERRENSFDTPDKTAA